MHTHTHFPRHAQIARGWAIETGYSPLLHVFEGIAAVAVSEEGENMVRYIHTYMILTVVGRVLGDLRRGER